MAQNKTRRGQSASSQSSTPAPMSAEARAAADDRIARARALPIVEEAKIPEPAPGYQPLTTDDKTYNIRTFGEDLYAESVVTMQHIGRKGDKLQQELGAECPPAKVATELVTRMEATQQSLRKARRLVEYLEALDYVNRHDTFLYLTAVHTSLEYRQRFDPTLADEYSQLSGLIEARGNRIAEGRERAKKVRQLTSELQGVKKRIEAAGIGVRPGQEDSSSDNGDGSEEDGEK